MNLGEKKLLLGLSGGSDSLYLFWQLLRQGVHFHAAHIDHGWRDESCREAKQLEDLCASYAIPFHCCRISPPVFSEEKCREKRYGFFSRIINEQKLDALVLAHHADDQSETVLKRIFEGASLPALGGIRPISYYKGMEVLRPLLQKRKKDLIVDGAFEDKTNFDPAYLRARMRNTLMPFLSRTFGKDPCRSLCQLAERADELAVYFREKTAPILQTKQKGPFGDWVDFSECSSLVEAKFALGLLMSASREQIACAALHLLARSGNKKIGEGIYVDRSRLFLLCKRPTWKMEICEAGVERTGWKAAMTGSLLVCLPKGDFQLAYARSRKLAKLWCGAKVPEPLGDMVPCIVKGGEGVKKEEVVHEFLSGKFCALNSLKLNRKMCYYRVFVL